MAPHPRTRTRAILEWIGFVTMLGGFAAVSCLVPMMVVGFSGGMEGFWELVPPLAGSGLVLLICGGLLQSYGTPASREWLRAPTQGSDPDSSGVRLRPHGRPREDAHARD